MQASSRAGQLPEKGSSPLSGEKGAGLLTGLGVQAGGHDEAHDHNQRYGTRRNSYNSVMPSTA